MTRITLLMPPSTAKKLARIVDRLKSDLAKSEPHAVRLVKTLKQHGIDISKISVRHEK